MVSSIAVWVGDDPKIGEPIIRLLIIQKLVKPNRRHGRIDGQKSTSQTSGGEKKTNQDISW